MPEDFDNLGPFITDDVQQQYYGDSADDMVWNIDEEGLRKVQEEITEDELEEEDIQALFEEGQQDNINLPQYLTNKDGVHLDVDEDGPGEFQEVLTEEGLEEEEEGKYDLQAFREEEQEDIDLSQFLTLEGVTDLDVAKEGLREFHEMLTEGELEEGDNIQAFRDGRENGAIDLSQLLTGEYNDDMDFAEEEVGNFQEMPTKEELDGSEDEMQGFHEVEVKEDSELTQVLSSEGFVDLDVADEEVDEFHEMLTREELEEDDILAFQEDMGEDAEETNEDIGLVQLFAGADVDESDWNAIAKEDRINSIENLEEKEDNNLVEATGTDEEKNTELILDSAYEDAKTFSSEGGDDGYNLERLLEDLDDEEEGGNGEDGDYQVDNGFTEILSSPDNDIDVIINDEDNDDEADEDNYAFTQFFTNDGDSSEEDDSFESILEDEEYGVDLDQLFVDEEDEQMLETDDETFSLGENEEGIPENIEYEIDVDMLEDNTDGSEDEAVEADPVFEEEEVGRIINGRNALTNAFPYVVYLTAFGKYCGGTLIDRHWVLTAAHCFTNR